MEPSGSESLAVRRSSALIIWLYVCVHVVGSGEQDLVFVVLMMDDATSVCEGRFVTDVMSQSLKC